MDISQLTSVLKNGANGRIDTFVLSDYFLFMNHQRYPLVFIKPIISYFLPNYAFDINKVFSSLSEITVTPKQYNNMSLSAKQVVCAIYIGLRLNMNEKDLYLSILSIVARYCEIHKDTPNDGATMELQAMDNFFNGYAPESLTSEDKRFVWDLAVSISPIYRKNKSNNELYNNMSDAVLMPTFGISWELFHNDMIRIERETMVQIDTEQHIKYLTSYFPNGWLGILKESPFANFPSRLLEQMISDK